jgi:hypothetical protein
MPWGNILPAFIEAFLHCLLVEQAVHVVGQYLLDWLAQLVLVARIAEMIVAVLHQSLGAVVKATLAECLILQAVQTLLDFPQAGMQLLQVVHQDIVMGAGGLRRFGDQFDQWRARTGRRCPGESVADTDRASGRSRPVGPAVSGPGLALAQQRAQALLLDPQRWHAEGLAGLVQLLLVLCLQLLAGFAEGLAQGLVARLHAQQDLLVGVVDAKADLACEVVVERALEQTRAVLLGAVAVGLQETVQRVAVVALQLAGALVADFIVTGMGLLFSLAGCVRCSLSWRRAGSCSSSSCDWVSRRSRLLRSACRFSSLGDEPFDVFEFLGERGMGSLALFEQLPGLQVPHRVDPELQAGNIGQFRADQVFEPGLLFGLGIQRPFGLAQLLFGLARIAFERVAEGGGGHGVTIPGSCRERG